MNVVLHLWPHDWCTFEKDKAKCGALVKSIQYLYMQANALSDSAKQYY